MKLPGTVLLVTLLFGAFIALLTPRVVQVQSLKARSSNLEQELLRLRKENQTLEKELKMLREDPVYLEKVARQKFNKAKEGEIVYKVVREGQTKSQG